MIVLIDNYDSFSYNLYQLLGQFDPDITVIRNDEKTVQDIEAMHPDHLIISPGPSAKSTAEPLPMPSSSCTANSP